MARVLHLFASPRTRLSMREAQEARALPHKGFEQCAHGRPGKRQLLLMAIETLRELDLAPGILKENVTTEGIQIQDLPRGQMLRIGEATVEITLSCEPCGLMNDVRPGLQEILRGRRGMLCRVVQEGVIRQGDAITKIELTKLGE